MKQFGIQIRDGVRISEGPKGRWVVYVNRNGKRKTFELDPLPGKALKTIVTSKGITSEDLRVKLSLDAVDFAECLQTLRINELIIETDVSAVMNTSASVAPNARHALVNAPKNRRESNIGLKRVDKYTFEVCDLSRYGWFTDSPISLFIRKFHSTLTLICIPLGLFLAWFFYHSPTKALGSKIVSEAFLHTSIFEVFGVVLVTQGLTAIYKICVGLGREYSSSTLYLKLMAGFHPVFEGGVDKPLAMTRSTSKWNYLAYIAAPQVMRASLLSLSILIIYLGYPFATGASQYIFKILLINISVSLITFFWAIFPSPGTVTFKALEIYNIIPPRLVGISVRTVFSRIPSEKIIRYRSFLVVMAGLILVKIVYLLFFLLPEFIYQVPDVFGEWTPQIFYAILLVMTIKFVIFRYSAESQKQLGRSGPAAPSPRAAGRSTAIAQPGSHSQKSFFEEFDIRNSLLFKKKKTLIAVLLVVLLFPFPSSVSGSAKIAEKMSLSIISTEQETSFVKRVVRSGPSASVIKKGEVIMELQSPALQSLISQARDNIESLRKSESILVTEIESLKEGSRFESSKNVNETIDQNISDIGALKYEIDSLNRQAVLLGSQVERYKKLAGVGAMSEIQYEDKVVELESKLTALRDSRAKYNNMVAELRRSRRTKLIDQSLSLSEELRTSKDKLKSTQADLSKEEKELRELERRRKELLVVAPFDCVIDSDTSLLLGKKVSYGDQLASVRSVPSEEVVISVPEYDRGEIDLSDKAEIRLYSKIATVLHGRVSSISPVTTESDDQEIVDVFISLGGNLPSNFIGATGSGKIRTGWTCLMWTLVKPVVRFVHVDLWSILP